MDIIRLKNIAVFAHHGVQADERELGQRFFLDIEMALDLSTAAEQDELDQSINYDAAYHTAVQAFTGTRCRLIERAAYLVIQALFAEFQAAVVTVRVRKPSAPIDGPLDTVEVELTRQYSEVVDA
ncbi:MAG: dihydroneopterin aldolase [Candidatus Marinimicrobia bacterium]|nr:dihydroneopterin aldolase [Candidatus Neomarinimicrobiota bacterium]